MQTRAGGAAKVHEGTGVLAGEAQHDAGLEVTLHPPAVVKLRQPLRYQAQTQHACLSMFGFDFW